MGLDASDKMPVGISFEDAYTAIQIGTAQMRREYPTKSLRNILLIFEPMQRVLAAIKSSSSRRLIGQRKAEEEAQKLRDELRRGRRSRTRLGTGGHV